MKSSLWQSLSTSRRNGNARRFRPASRNRRGFITLVASRAVRKPAQILCAGLLLLAALGFTLASSGANQSTSSGGPLPQLSTSLNGPGNVFLTAEAIGTGIQIPSMAIADFNGDGIPDLIGELRLHSYSWQHFECDARAAAVLGCSRIAE